MGRHSLDEFEDIRHYLRHAGDERALQALEVGDIPRVA